MVATRLLAGVIVVTLGAVPGHAGPVSQRRVEGASSPAAIGLSEARTGGRRVATVGIIAFRGAMTIDGTSEPATDPGLLLLLCKARACSFVRPAVSIAELGPNGGLHVEAADGPRKIELDWTPTSNDARGCSIGITRRYLVMGLGYTISAGVAKTATVTGRIGSMRLAGSTCTFVSPAARFDAAMSWAR